MYLSFQNDTVSLRDKVTVNTSEKWRILKNIIAVSFAFMVQFTAFQVSHLCFHCDVSFTMFHSISTGDGKPSIIDQRKGWAGNSVA